MIIVSVTQFQIYLLWGQHPFSIVGAFNQEEALVGTFSVIVKSLGTFA